MQVTIIPDESLIIIDGKQQTFDVSYPDIHAIQWSDTQGEIEYKNGTHEIINSTELFNDVIQTFSDNESLITSAKEETLDNITVTYASGESETISRDEAIARNIAFDGLSLENLKQAKLMELKVAFVSDSLMPVDGEGTQWNGGVDSAVILNSHAENLIYQAKAIGVVHDINNDPHELPVTTIKQLASAIGDAYQVKYEKFQTLKRQVRDAVTTEEVRAIAYV